MYILGFERQNDLPSLNTIFGDANKYLCCEAIVVTHILLFSFIFRSLEAVHLCVC